MMDNPRRRLKWVCCLFVARVEFNEEDILNFAESQRQKLCFTNIYVY
jgi:hypothetical protein